MVCVFVSEHSAGVLSPAVISMLTTMAVMTGAGEGLRRGLASGVIFLASWVIANEVKQSPALKREMASVAVLTRYDNGCAGDGALGEPSASPSVAAPALSLPKGCLAMTYGGSSETAARVSACEKYAPRFNGMEILAWTEEKCQGTSTGFQG